MTLPVLILRYSAFAVIAMLANLLTQRGVLMMGDSAALFAAAMAAGTLIGLMVKYLLDRRWIFYDQDAGFGRQSRKFSRYTMMGVVTTALFWGTETACWLIWRTDMMRELGAVLGLTIGYIAKYQLDRRFVFVNRSLKAVS